METTSSDKHKWYVVHCHSGYEKKVGDSILNEAKKLELEEMISEVSVPTQAVVEVRRGVRINSEKKLITKDCTIKFNRRQNDKSKMNFRILLLLTQFYLLSLIKNKY